MDDLAPLIRAYRRAFRDVCEVEGATSAREALAKIDGGLHPDLVLSDICMNGIRGDELALALAARGIRVALMSAFPHEVAAAREAPTGAIACLEKPADVADIVPLVLDLARDAAVSPRAMPAPVTPHHLPTCRAIPPDLLPFWNAARVGFLCCDQEGGVLFDPNQLAKEFVDWRVVPKSVLAQAGSPRPSILSGGRGKDILVWVARVGAAFLVQIQPVVERAVDAKVRRFLEERGVKEQHIRFCLLLRDGFSVEEIAARMDVSRATAFRMQKRLLTLLRVRTPLQLLGTVQRGITDDS